MGIDEIIKKGIELKASDIHITANSAPAYRIDGSLDFTVDSKKFTAEDIMLLSEEILPGNLEKKLHADGQVDFAYSFLELARIRVNIYKQMGNFVVAIRLLPDKIPVLNDLCLPPVIGKLALAKKGLILVTGAAGSGKSTTLAAMIGLINKSKSCCIITLEDPIEYLHQHRRGIINQRQIGDDISCFATGLKAALRQDPDVIMVGEMRDLETISTAITAAETGHLVLATIHAGSAVQTIERVIAAFPPYQQPQIRLQLATTLLGVINQRLIPRLDGRGRIAAAEVLMVSPAIRNLIRENKIHQIYSTMQLGSGQNMITMEKAMKNLLNRGLISHQETI